MIFAAVSDFCKKKECFLDPDHQFVDCGALLPEQLSMNSKFGSPPYLLCSPARVFA